MRLVRYLPPLGAYVEELGTAVFCMISRSRPRSPSSLFDSTFAQDPFAIAQLKIWFNKALGEARSFPPPFREACDNMFILSR